MKVVSSRFLIVVLLGICLACSQVLDKPAYMSFVSSYEHGLHQKKEVGDYVFDVQYKPTAYKALQESPAKASMEQLATFIKEDSLDGMQYYDLKIGVKGNQIDILKFGAANEQAYYQKLYYFSYEFAQDIYIMQNGKKLPCKLFHFERSYDLSPMRTFILGFEKPAGKEQTRTLVIDSNLFGTGAVKILFEEKILPVLKF